MWINIAFLICLATVSYSRTLISSSQVQVPRHNPSEDDLATVSDVQTFVSSDQMQIPDRTEQFTNADANGDGKLSFDEFLHKDNYWIDLQRDLFNRIDTNGDGYVTLAEQQSFDERMQQEGEEQMENMTRDDFDYADTNHDGVISKNEISDYAIRHMGVIPDSAVGQYFDQVDENGDGTLNYQEFKDFDQHWYESNRQFLPIPFAALDRIVQQQYMTVDNTVYTNIRRLFVT